MDILNTLTIVVPVIVMLILGYFCSNVGILNQNGTATIKKYIINIALPIAVFHAMATAEYNLNVVLLFFIMLAVLCAGLGVGFLLKIIVREDYRPYFPFLMTVYEGGLLGYPLYTNICGSDHLSTLALLDFAGMIFGFGIYFSLLGLMESGKKINFSDIVKSAFTSPTFIAVLIGMVTGLTPLMNLFLNTEVSRLYISVKDMITVCMNSMILLCVGADLGINASLIKECFKTVVARLCVSLCFLGIILLIFKAMHMDGYMMIAAILYMLLTPSFALSSFVKKEEASSYIATTVSMYMPITVIVYILLAVFKNFFLG